MDYDKKVLLLRQMEGGYSLTNADACGIARIEVDYGIATVHLSTVNLKGISKGVYRLYLMDGQKHLYRFDLDSRPLSATKNLLPLPEIKRGFCAGLYHVERDIPCQVLYGKSAEFEISLSNFNSAVADKCLQEFKEKLQEDGLTCQSPCTTSSSESKEDIDKKANDKIKAVYDDEAVATENYYDYGKEIKSKLKSVKDWDFEDCCNEDGATDLLCQEKETKEHTCSTRCENEDDTNSLQKYSKENPYYQTVKGEIEEIFAKFPQENCLKGIFPESMWAKIQYSKNKHYLVGVIKENSCVKQLCYGVPAKYSQTPPEELKGFCTFIPLSVYDLKGQGFWMMFQDAITGECLTPKVE